MKIDTNGYVKDLRCKQGHSGNTRYVLVGGYCQCQGCGNFILIPEPRRGELRKVARKMRAGGYAVTVENFDGKWTLRGQRGDGGGVWIA